MRSEHTQPPLIHEYTLRFDFPPASIKYLEHRLRVTAAYSMKVITILVTFGFSFFRGALRVT